MLDVYSIPLEFLYFNNENGRIASQIKREYGTLDPHTDKSGRDYNDKIAEFIVSDNESAFKKTKKSIKQKGQQVYGYVLQDGRIIDGNRRFTALRQLEAETGQTWNFEAVILPFTYDAKVNRTQIKRLELAIQMGTEERQDYDPVDLAVDVYNTVEKDHLMTAQDYALEADIKIGEIERKIETVELIKDFLVFINAQEEAYYFIKDLKLYNPLYELAKIFKKKYPKKGSKYEQEKITAFVMLNKMAMTGGDTVREVRDYSKSIIGKEDGDAFNKEIEDAVDDFRDILEEKPIDSVADLNSRLEAAAPELREVNEKYDSIVKRQNRGKNINNFISDIKDMSETLKDLQKGDGLTGNLHFNNFSESQIREIRDLLISINLASGDLLEVYEDEL